MFAKLTLATVASMVMATAAVAQDKTVRMGTEGYYPPFNFFDSAGQIKGFDIDIGNALCERMKVTCEWVATDWDGIIPALNSDKFDTIIASMTITDERSKVVSFSDPYYFNSVRFVAAKGHGLSGAMPVDLSGMIIGTQSATGEVDILEQYFPDSELKLYPKLDDALLDMEAGRVDLVLASQFVLGDWLKSDEGSCCEFVGETFIPDFAKGTGIAVRQDDTELRDALNKALAEIVADGTYGKIRDQYFSFDIMTQPKKTSELFGN
ncbi:transporter substrate-binding domain-containing protein [Tropicibacter sp. R16_0]|uniref:transporter substrate-binding domain-containing protein n=1 Tax=Tropicibacter sp. R16_0 TaxID=2821102 RepID=UPI001ADAFD0D|nr:transporter substrate-binding domain-containing protein [Tropicibacter sp. R16_0]MBO9451276.1 transporter substrate-binding domain-containing protein [Tropicibacter sp. R16_0]